MIKKIQRRFIMIAMISVIVVLSIIITAINVINYKNVTVDVDRVMSMLSNNDGNFPKPENLDMIDMDGTKQFGEGNRRYSNQKPDEQSTEAILRDNKEFDRFLRENRMSAETPYETRFFSVKVDNDGNKLSINTGNIASVDEESALLYVSKADKKNKSKGYIGNYRYYIKNTDYGKLYIFVNCEKQLTTVKGFLKASIYISLAGVCAVFVLVIFFSRLVMRPIQDAYDKQKRFITDSSHEIKTPLAVISANTEVIEMVNGESEWTKSITKQVERLTSLTKSMTALARMDEEGFKLNKLKFNMSDAVVDTVAAFDVLAKNKNIDMTADIDDNIEYYGEEKLIRQLVNILMDNAIKYCDGKIVVSLKKNKGKIKYSVYNTATNIDTKNLDHFFERFYRADASRNSETSGFGIGLSSAKSIVDLHGGSISARSDDGKSIKITAIL